MVKIILGYIALLTFWGIISYQILIESKES